jgi:hypothetical protein
LSLSARISQPFSSVFLTTNQHQQQQP